MELKKGSQTSRPTEVSLKVEGTAVPQLFTGSRSNSESVPEDPEEIDNSRISTDTSILTSDNSRISTDGSIPPEKEKEYDVSNEAIYKLEEYFQSSSSSSTSRISDVTHESSIPNQHPPIQVMDRRGSFDSQRIPASIFAKPAASIMDWSIVSNESLFSIQIGKGSISIDHAFILDLDHSQVFSINEGSNSFKDLNELEESIKSEQVKESGDQLGICKKAIPKENKEKPQLFGLGTRISEEPIVNRHYRSTSDGTKMKIEGFGNGKPNQALSKQKSPESFCSNCGCTLCHCFSISSCCSCKCFSFPTCGFDSWPSCSCKSSWWSSSWSSCSSCCCKPSTWECCKCRCPTWSIEKIFCCLSSKSSAKFPSRLKKASDTDAKNWCTCFSCYSCC